MSLEDTYDAEERQLAFLSADEVMEKWDGLAVRVAQRCHRRVPVYAYDDLLQVCRVALWNAYQEWDPDHGTPWRLYATNVIWRDANEFVMVERRRGLTKIGDRAALSKGEDYTGPAVHNLGPRDDWVKWSKVYKDQSAVGELLDLLRSKGVTNRAMEVVELIVRFNMTQQQAATELGISRQAVSERLAKVRIILRNQMLKERR